MLDQPDPCRFANRSFCPMSKSPGRHRSARSSMTSAKAVGSARDSAPPVGPSFWPKDRRGLWNRPVLPVDRPARRLLDARGLWPRDSVQQILLAIEDVTERVRLEREHAIAHERIGMLMQELTHRVKNSLQSIAAMVFIEARDHKSGEGKAALERVSHRIDALGQLYSKLSKSDTVEAVNAATYLDDLCRDLIASVDREGERAIVLKTDIESVLLPTDRAIPIGLIVNELVTNAVKYAFPGKSSGTVTVVLKREPGVLRLTVADDGKGVDPRRADSGLGGRLVEGFAQQLGGQVERESGSQGTTVCLIMPSREDLDSK